MATALIAIGFASVIAQILVLRELVAIFNGNELTYGISLMIWLLSGGLGCYIAGKLAPKLEIPLKTLIFTELAVSLIIPAEILFARLSKLIFNIPAGAIPDFTSILIISVITIAPINLLLGLLFTIGSSALKNIGRMYIIESLGAALGGIIFSFIFIYFFNPFQISGMTGFILSTSALYIYKHHVRNDTSARISTLVFFSFVLAANLILIHPAGQKIDRYASKMHFKGLNLVSSLDSIYGRISVIKDRGAFSYFESGSLMFSTASVAENEELVHLSFLEAKNPKSVLLIGGGLGGVIQEILKYNNIKKLDYVEFDPKLVSMANYKFPAIVTDGRHFIKSAGQRYDLIVINVGDPTNAALNRFYTYEFMMSCKDRLTRGGVLTMRLSAGEAFMRAELRKLNSSIYKTLNLAFSQVIVIPGIYNYYFATDKAGILTSNSSKLVKRWESHFVPTKYFNELAIPHIAEPFKLRSMEKAVKYDNKTKMNTDFKPISYTYSVLTWLSYFPGVISIQLQKLQNIGLQSLIFWLFAAALTYKLAGIKIKRIRDFTLPTVIGLTGFCAMTLELLAIYSFQAIYGYIYFKIGLLIAVFMGGLAAGGYLTNIKYQNVKIGRLIGLLIISTAGFVLYLIFTPKLPYQLSEFFIPLFSFVFAVLVGAVFPVAVKTYRSKSLENTAGVLYGADLAGGAVSALFSSVWFLPVYGITGTCALSLTLNLVSLVLIFPLRGTHPR